jgi:pilus assembly protein CpaC
VDKIPLLGDIPILGSLFRSKEVRQNRSELIVLVTPVIVRPMDEQPPVPTGEPDTWDWMGGLELAPALDTADFRTDGS